uniref:Integrase catalytic domain-containing protein n=2 Tax=Haemophilus parainfluenzae TaxID=729 RepID=A0A369YXY8_HAEPA|nr:hypothetical protein DPV87_09800 [Haemophilus parainfluenzae]
MGTVCKRILAPIKPFSIVFHTIQVKNMLKYIRTIKTTKFSLVKKMLEQGLSRIKPTECPIIHSDQGVLYGSAEWVKMLEGKAVQSMSRRGNCYDNAVIESFFAILKSECFYSRTYHSIAELQAEIEEYLVYYNQKTN